MRGGIFPRRTGFYDVPAFSRHGGTIAGFGKFAKCSLENAAGLKIWQN
jgi:hypothetical protein